MKSRISWIEKQLKSDSRKGIEAQILAEHKKKEREAAKQGKKPYFLKKSEIRNRRLIEKFNTLKASGRIDKVFKQKRRQKTAKDRRFMPYKRSNDQTHNAFEKDNGQWRKGDVEFDTQLQMALSATTLVNPKRESAGDINTSSSSPSEFHSPLKKLKKLKKLNK